MNTGEEPVKSTHGLLTTVGYRIGDEPVVRVGRLHRGHRSAGPVDAGPVELIGSAPEIETLAKTVEDNGGAYFVPGSPACSHRTGGATRAASSRA